MQDQTEYNLTPYITYVTFRKCTPRWTLPKHVLPNYDITYVSAGNAQYMVNGKQYNLVPGHLLCLPPGTMREGVTFPDRPMRCYSVNFHLRDINGGPVGLPFPRLTQIGSRKDLVRLFNELNFTWLEKQPGYTIKMHGLLMTILHRLFELLVYDIDSSADDYRITKVIRYIADHYPEKLTIKKMSSMTGLQPNYFNALFKQKTGLSMHRYVIRTRIRNAYNMLLGGEYRVTEIAERCGYSDVYHFYKQFKAVMDITPSQCIPRG